MGKSASVEYDYRGDQLRRIIEAAPGAGERFQIKISARTPIAGARGVTHWLGITADELRHIAEYLAEKA